MSTIKNHFSHFFTMSRRFVAENVSTITCKYLPRFVHFASLSAPVKNFIGFFLRRQHLMPWSSLRGIKRSYVQRVVVSIYKPFYGALFSVSVCFEAVSSRSDQQTISQFRCTRALKILRTLRNRFGNARAIFANCFIESSLGLGNWINW